MFLARCEDDNGKPVIGVGLEPDDVARLVSGRPRSFALSDALVEGPDAQERVLVAYASPAQMEQMRNGYFPGITDARVVLFLDHSTLKWAQQGQPLDIQTPGAPIGRFVVFLAPNPGRSHAVRAFNAVGLHCREAAPRLPLTAATLEQMTAPVG